MSFQVPPKLAVWLFSHFRPRGDVDIILGDLEEEFQELSAAYGSSEAQRWYWRQLIKSTPGFTLELCNWTFIMIKHFIRTATRSFWRYKSYTTINVAGLTVGLACAFLILLWVNDEYAHDAHHENSQQMYRVMQNTLMADGSTVTSNVAPEPLDFVLDTEYPEVIASIRMSYQQTRLLSIDERVVRRKGRHVDPEYFDVFTHPTILGDPQTALSDPNAIVLTASLASNLFGENWQTDPNLLGSIIKIENTEDVVVTGVLVDVEEQSSFTYDFLRPMEAYLLNRAWVRSWRSSNLSIFALLAEGTRSEALTAKIGGLVQEQDAESSNTLFLQPFTDIYLRSEFDGGVVTGGRIDTVRMFSIVGFFILLIACINFMNLATARSAQRMREIGVRTALGASRSLLAWQFLGESIVLTSTAFLLAMGLVVLLLPGFNMLTGKALSLNIYDGGMWIQFAGIAFITGLVAGSYPALFLSSRNAISTLRNRIGVMGGNVQLRKSLVVVQFGISMILIVGTITISNQIDFIRSKNIGLDRENLITIEREGALEDQFESFRHTLLSAPGITSVASADASPLSVGTATTGVMWEGRDTDQVIAFHILAADYDFIDVAKIEIADGRYFSPDFGTDETGFVINEKAAQAMGMEEPVGQSLAFWGMNGTVVGVVKDFHSTSLYSAIEPLIITLDESDTNTIFVRAELGQVSKALTSIETIYAQFNPGYPFNYSFVDDEFESMYRSDQVLGDLARYFTLIAIFVACLGMFGLASFMAGSRTKEIGIRKVLGASAANVTVLLSREFVGLVVIAFLFAAPISYIVMQKWLGGFAYHTDVGIEILAIAGLSTILIAVLTVSYKSLIAASANPVNSLRSE